MARPDAGAAGLSGNIRLGLRLRELRDERGLTMAEVTAMTGGEIPVATLGAYERGIRSIPALRLARLAAAYEITVDEVVGPVLDLPAAEAADRDEGRGGHRAASDGPRPLHGRRPGAAHRR